MEENKIIKDFFNGEEQRNQDKAKTLNYIKKVLDEPSYKDLRNLWRELNTAYNINSRSLIMVLFIAYHKNSLEYYTYDENTETTQLINCSFLQNTNIITTNTLRKPSKVFLYVSQDGEVVNPHNPPDDAFRLLRPEIQERCLDVFHSVIRSSLSNNIIGNDLPSDSNLSISDDDDAVNITPSSNFSYLKFIQAMKNDPDSKILFNDNLPKNHNLINSKYIQTLKIRVNYVQGVALLPVTLQAMCPDCRKMVVFTKYDYSGDIECPSCERFTAKGEPRPVKLKINSNSVVTGSNVKVYEVVCDVYDYDEKVFKPISQPVFSTVKLTNGVAEVQGVFNDDVENNFFLVFSHNTDFSATPSPILSSLPRFSQNQIINQSFLESIYFKLIVPYLRVEHNMKINRQNLVPNLYMLFSSLMNEFFDIRQRVFLLGSSGSGKSFASSNIVPIASSNMVTVSATTVSKNVLLGGLSENSSMFKNRYKAGILSTQKVVVAEEASESLSKFLIEPRTRNSNMFTLLKEANADRTNLSTMGTRQHKITSTVFALGNLRNMASDSVLRSWVEKEYRKLTGESLTIPNLPLYRSLEWYHKTYEDENIAKAFYNIRAGTTLTRKQYAQGVHWDFSIVDKFLAIPPAEAARFDMVIALEKVGDDTPDLSIGDGDDDSYVATSIDYDNLHTEQFLDLLKQRFPKISLGKRVDEKYVPFLSEVERYVLNEYLVGRNNYKLHSSDDINSHIRESVVKRCQAFCLMDCLFKNEPLQLTNDLKRLWERFDVYNRNSLSVSEAAGLSQPLVNDSYVFNRASSVQVNDDLVDSIVEAKKKEKEEENNYLSELVGDENE